jgi:hypothetical protein
MMPFAPFGSAERFHLTIVEWNGLVNKRRFDERFNRGLKRRKAWSIATKAVLHAQVGGARAI